MNTNSFQDGALATCAACAVQLGADPMVAPVVAGIIAVAIKYIISAVGYSVAEYRKKRAAKEG